MLLDLERGLESLLNGFPALLHNGFALCAEHIAFAGECHGGLVIDVLLTSGRQKSHGNQPEDFLLRFRQCGNVLLLKLDGRDNGMVIRDLRIVCDTPEVGSIAQAVESRHLPAHNSDDLTDGAFHVIRDELTVGAGIGKQLLFIEGLHLIEGLLCREAVIPVGFPLQGGQIVELRGIDRLRLALDRRNDGLFLITSRRNRLCLIFGFDLLHISGEIAAVHMDIEVFLFLECADLPVALCQHCQRGGLDTANHQLLVIERGKQPGVIDAHNPVCL